MMKTTHARLAVALLLGWAVSASAVLAADAAPAKALKQPAKAAAPDAKAPAQPAPAKKEPAKKEPAKKEPAKKAEEADGPKKIEPVKKIEKAIEKIEKKIEAPDKQEAEKAEPKKPKLPPVAAWKQPQVDEVRARVLAWLDEKGADAALRAKAEQIWSFDPADATGTDLLVHTAATFALVDENARPLVEMCSRPRIDLVLPSFPWLLDPASDRFETANLRLLFGRWLGHESLYDEALVQLTGLEPADVVDPASLLFYQSVVTHRLLDKEATLRTIDGLMLNSEDSPRRYVVLAGLMREDIKDLKDDSLDHIARRMEDIERRLDLGRAGQKVRKVEDGVIESLDKLIKKLEDQQKQQSGGGGSANNTRSQSPAQDSRIMGGKGPGDVVKKDIGSKSGWGNLPPKQRDEALQQIGRDFPSHYRDKIEEYFRKLANEGSELPESK